MISWHEVRILFCTEILFCWHCQPDTRIRKVKAGIFSPLHEQRSCVNTPVVFWRTVIFHAALVRSTGYNKCPSWLHPVTKLIGKTPLCIILTMVNQIHLSLPIKYNGENSGRTPGVGGRRCASGWFHCLPTIRPQARSNFSSCLVIRKMGILRAFLPTFFQQC